MKIEYTGHYVDEQNRVCVCLRVSVGGGPSRHHVVKIWARAFDTQEVHDAMAAAAIRLLEPSGLPPWEEDALPIWG